MVWSFLTQSWGLLISFAGFGLNLTLPAFAWLGLFVLVVGYKVVIRKRR